MCTALHLLVMATAADPPVFYVDASGGEDLPGNGTQVAPWATIDFAMQQIVARGVTNGYNLYLREGIYREVVRSVVSGSSVHRAVLSAYPGETAVTSGAEPVTGWAATGIPGVYRASLSDAQCAFRGVYEDGRALHAARYPEEDNTVLVAEELTRTYLVDPAL